MADFLLELLSEEIPARMQERARADLARLFADEIARSGLAADAIETFATPRRLALIARGLPLATAATAIETKGPRASAPPQALEGFLRKIGLVRDQLVERDGVLFAIVEQPGRATAQVLADAIPAIVRAFPWPKSMRWGAASAETTSLRWVRPLHGIVALLGEDVVPFAIEGVRSGAATLGHRFHHPGQITIGSAADYADKLRMCHVLVDPDERRALIREGGAALAAGAGLTVVADEALVAENAGLTEWPVPLLGHFDPAFLDLPREVIQLTLGINQKYFVLNDAGGKLAPAFLCTANIEAADGGEAIVAGNGRVLSARLSDARFFWEQDRKRTLEQHAGKLKDIVFHEKLGTVADKVGRVAELARWLAEEEIVKGADADLAEQAAKLCKADLVTGMVGEFPELQGVIGGYYARAEGLPDEVADAIRDHYKPVGQGDEVPAAPVTVAVSLADKLDTLLGFFARAERPTGSKDPFALRRAALSILALLFRHDLRLDLADLSNWVGMYFIYDQDGADDLYLNLLFGRLSLKDRNFESAMEDGNIVYRHGDEILLTIPREPSDDLAGDLNDVVWEGYEDFMAFMVERVKVQQRSAGVRYDVIDAASRMWTDKSALTGVFELDSDLVRLLARVRALQAFVGMEEGANLLAGYRRAANILRKEGWAPSTADENSLSYTPEKAETGLLAALDVAGPLAARAVGDEDFAGAMAALASLRAPIDAFFETVTVNDPDPARRAARLALLARIRDAVHQVADFSKIEG